MRLILPLIALVLTTGIYVLVQGNQGAAGAAGLAAVWGPLRLAAEIGIWLSAAWFGKSLLALGVLRYSGRRGRGAGSSLLINGVPQLLIDVGGLVLFLAAVLGIVAYVFGQSLGGLLATSGVLAAIIGFAMQRMISDIFSGVALNVERSFAIGDWLVTSTGVTGKVVEHTWRAIHLVTFDGRAVVVPNSVLIGNQFTNLNAPQRQFRQAENICLEYSVPPERAISILETAMEMTDGILPQPKPVVLIVSCGDNGIVYSMNFWVPDYPESFILSRQVVANALKLLDQAGLAPAYPKRDVAMFDAPQRQIQYEMDVPAILRRVALLKVLDEESLETLAQQTRLRDFPANAAIVEEGEPGESLFVIVSGLLIASRRGQSAQPRTIGRLVAGEAFGEMSLLTGAPRSATIQAATPVTLIEISKETLEPILKRHPALITRLSEIQSARMATQIDAATLSQDEAEQLRTSGFAAVMRQRIARFFGSARTGK